MRRFIAAVRQRALPVFTALMIAIGGGLVATASPAAAAGNPYVWDDVRGRVPLYAVPNTTSVIQRWAANGTRIRLICWQDNQNRRWFWGQLFDRGDYRYVEARLVGNQIVVGRC